MAAEGNNGMVGMAVADGQAIGLPQSRAQTRLRRQTLSVVACRFRPGGQHGSARSAEPRRVAPISGTAPRVLRGASGVGFKCGR